MTRSATPPSECPVCGADVPRGAKACPACGADERSGWNEDETRYDGLDLPDSAFGDESAPRKTGRPGRRLSNGVPVFWAVVGVLLAAILIWGVVGL